jgi:hypothetical protein
MDSERPAFHGLVAYRHLGLRFSFLYPSDWHRLDLDPAAGGGTVCYPDAADQGTTLLAQGRRLRLRARPEDLSQLRSGFLEGLQALPGLEIESETASVTGALLDLQARHSYRAGPETRKRWVRLLYQDRLQISISAEGSSPAAYDYWLPMFTTVMHTVRFGDWWAEATGTSWRRALEPPRARPRTRPEAPPGEGEPA